MQEFFVRRSPIHGRGVFADTIIAHADYLLEYKGEVLSEREANHRVARTKAWRAARHFFGLGDGRAIDGAVSGNSACWISQSCETNREAEQDGDRMCTRTIEKIKLGKQTFIDYRLDTGSRTTKKLTATYGRRCGAKNCRLTMLYVQ
ncbi:SET domain-containing protein [Caballeronia sordidicola]|uniref:Proteins containing SET domain n=1 Tax=Caballeronia sordidicola TaxID=196367 RepID=A0A242MNE8_CABSO|nr:SET domain-containing protein [Caballeronia sordidicola]OTP72847.1 Proteins containing SET domain [Caballeronia sordidicola]